MRTNPAFLPLPPLPLPSPPTRPPTPPHILRVKLNIKKIGYIPQPDSNARRFLFIIIIIFLSRQRTGLDVCWLFKHAGRKSIKPANVIDNGGAWSDCILTWKSIKLQVKNRRKIYIYILQTHCSGPNLLVSYTLPHNSWPAGRSWYC